MDGEVLWSLQSPAFTDEDAPEVLARRKVVAFYAIAVEQGQELRERCSLVGLALLNLPDLRADGDQRVNKAVQLRLRAST